MSSVKIIMTGCLLGFVCSAFAAGPYQSYSGNVPEDPIGFATYMYVSESDLDQTGNGQVTVQEAEALMSMPVIESDNTIFLTGGRVKWTGLEYKNITDMRDQDLYVISVPLDLIYGKGEPWLFWGNVSPGLASDLDNINSDDYNTTAAGIGMYQWTPNLAFVLGFAYDREFGDDKLYPLGGVRWLIGDEWEINAILPTLRIGYSPTKKLFFNVHLHAAGDKWHMRDENKNEYDVKVETYRIGAGIQYSLSKNIWLNFATGIDVERNYEIRNKDTRIIDDNAEDATFVRIGLLIR